MTHRKMIVNAVVLSALLAMIFTGNTGNVAVSAGNSNPASSPAQADGIETSDDILAAVARQVPGFGGMFFDQDGILQVYMAGQKGTANEALTAFLDDVITREVGRGERLSSKGVEILEGQYDFLDLHSWQQRMSPSVLALPGVVFTDIDEKENRLRIGVADSPGGAKAVEEHLFTLGVPREAVLISETEPVWPALRSRRRPLRGGLQINFGNFLCTLGFAAIRQGRTGFVTNSHCTNKQGGIEDTFYYQPTFGPSNFVGFETADPPYFTGGSCPAGRRCRFSDSAFVEKAALERTALGSIARPAVGSFTWNGVDTFTITAESGPLVGQSVTKVGRTTGRTQGFITQTCVNVSQAGTTITLLCQSRADFFVDSGDSGSPVFRVTTTPNVALVGILWGKPGFFSPITNIQNGTNELGPMTNCATGGC